MKESIIEIKNKFADKDILKINEIIQLYCNDERKGVKNIIESYKNKYNKYLLEIERINKMYNFEKVYYNKGLNYIAGIDEVGRGPLAGPVVTAAVILPKDCILMGVNDSKKISAKKRELLNELIYEKAISIGIGIISNNVIDEINILQATYKAMQMSVKKLNIKPECLLVDALKIPELDIFQHSIIKGDEKSISIASASIAAKVYRDNLMIKYDEIYPEYDFKNNKGYGCKNHIKAIKKYGLCPIHRKSFTQNILQGNDLDEN